MGRPPCTSSPTASRSWIYELTADGPPRRVAYEQTEHFRVYRDFLNRYPRMIELLLEGEY